MFHPHLFLLDWLKLESSSIVRSVETDLGTRILEVAVISVNTYLFLVFSDLICLIEDTGIGVFWLTVPPDCKETEVGSRDQQQRLFYQQKKILRYF